MDENEEMRRALWALMTLAKSVGSKEGVEAAEFAIQGFEQTVREDRIAHQETAIGDLQATVCGLRIALGDVYSRARDGLEEDHG